MCLCVFQEERSLGEERATELSRLTGVFTLRRTQEIIGQYLPGRVEWTLFCRPTPLQTSLYTHLLSTRAVRACLNASVPHLGTHSPHLACISALKKLCNHPGLLYNTMKVCVCVCISVCLCVDQRRKLFCVSLVKATAFSWPIRSFSPREFQTLNICLKEQNSSPHILSWLHCCCVNM